MAKNTKQKKTHQHMALTDSSSPSHAPPVVAAAAAAAPAVVVLGRVAFGIASNGALATSTDLFVHSVCWVSPVPRAWSKEYEKLEAPKQAFVEAIEGW